MPGSLIFASALRYFQRDTGNGVERAGRVGDREEVGNRERAGSHVVREHGGEQFGIGLDGVERVDGQLGEGGEWHPNRGALHR